MRLSEKEKQLLCELELQASRPISEVVEATGYRDHAIRYGLKRLEDRAAIQRIPVINVGAIGYEMRSIFFSLTAEQSGLKRKLVRYFLRAKQVVWLGEFSGDFQYGVGVCCRSLHELQGFLEDFTETFGHIFHEKQASSQFRVTRYPRKYLGKTTSKSIIVYEHCEEVKEVDELDTEILSAFSKAGRKSLRALARQLAIPLSTLDHRVRRLEEREIICGYVYNVNSEVIASQEFKLLLFTRGLSSSISEEVRAFASQSPYVTLLVECFGAWDFELNIEVPRPQEVTEITQSLCSHLGDKLSSLKTLTKFSDIKYITHPAAIFAEDHRSSAL